jgi:endonuclease YncB( thermonuclease family)
MQNATARAIEGNLGGFCVCPGAGDGGRQASDHITRINAVNSPHTITNAPMIFQVASSRRERPGRVPEPWALANCISNLNHGIERHVGRRDDRASERDRWRHARNTQYAHSFVGIDESTQLCRGEDSDPYRCGVQAANDLDTFIARRPVNCHPFSLDRYWRTVATCSVGGADLGEWLVRNGLAVDWPQYSHGRYDAVQREAEQAGRGTWKGSYVEPWLYRVCIRAGGKPADCSDDANAYP